MQIQTISEKLKETYGQKIYRLALSSGCTCPNRDGTLSTGGCTFCSEGGSGDFAAPLLPIAEQIRLAREKVDAKITSKIPPEQRKYIAYFQSFTNTYARNAEELERLRKLYTETIRRPEIVILSLGTRPDCLGDEVIDMLQEVQAAAPEKPIWIELGLQTSNDQTAERIHRGYALSAFTNAYKRLKMNGFAVIAHVILGLPGESREDMLNTIHYLAGLHPVLDGVKIQLLHVLKGTALGRAYEQEPFPLLTMDAYTDLVVDCLALLPEETVVHRMTGDGPRSLLLGPMWSTDKKRVLNTLNKKIRECPSLK